MAMQVAILGFTVGSRTANVITAIKLLTCFYYALVVNAFTIHWAFSC